MPPSPQAPPASRRAKGAVIKKLSPAMPGTRHLLERHGAALVCDEIKQRRLWRATIRTIKQLGIADRVVEIA